VTNFQSGAILQHFVRTSDCKVGWCRCLRSRAKFVDDGAADVDDEDDEVEEEGGIIVNMMMNVCAVARRPL
jgi:hypothetical protein